MKDIRYGPTHACPRCGRMICYRSDSQHRRPYALDGDSPLRHVCPVVSGAVRDFGLLRELEEVAPLPNGVIILPQ